MSSRILLNHNNYHGTICILSRAVLVTANNPTTPHSMGQANIARNRHSGNSD
ncbi:uncharacterized protein RAG0_10307 [Rhynchosporium agropyri]|uniref:Uncharacterized protein n=1 Tax=Rhynchosporium agropyri TaxID=914238 RepID=A0A1E1KZA0_9HELO|nr:uncharacterized protein RAG0_10307 [Rhynchosporium agropyri]